MITVDDSKSLKQLFDICTKLVNLYNECYISSLGYIVNLEIEKPYLVQLDEEDLNLFQLLHGEFKLLHIMDVKVYKAYIKKVWFPDKKKGVEPPTKEEQEELQRTFLENLPKYSLEIPRSITVKVNELISKRLTTYRSMKQWSRFTLSNNEEENQLLLEKVFKSNDYVLFKPSPTIPSVILTKSLLPIVSQKNYTDVLFSIEKLVDELYLLVFDFDFAYFRVLMFHYFIDIDTQ